MEISSPPPPKMTDDNSRCVDKNPAVKEDIDFWKRHRLRHMHRYPRQSSTNKNDDATGKFDKSEEKETRLLRCYSYRE